MDRAGPFPRAADLAPGDVAATDFDWSALTLHRVTGPADPEFHAAYDRLWREFGPKGEMERRPVIEERLGWRPDRPAGDAVLQYEMLVVRRGPEMVAVRDHTAVVRLGPDARPRPGPVVVHLSHAFVAPSYRGTGLAAWLRALPLETARRCARAVRRPPDTPTVLVAEMEHPSPGDDERHRRLRSYERAGFRKVDPAAVPYHQPDFHGPDEPGDGGPVPLALVLRRVGQEREPYLPADELEAIVESIYAVYARHVPPAALEPLRVAAMDWTARQHLVRLLPPTA